MPANDPQTTRRGPRTLPETARKRPANDPRKDLQFSAGALIFKKTCGLKKRVLTPLFIYHWTPINERRGGALHTNYNSHN